MKKTVITPIFILAFALAGFSQNVISSSGNNTQDFSNEIKLNFLNLIVLGSIEVGYEKFLGHDHSLDL